jgi:3-hydroxyisobutyrate dehydrogenase-like beta-hydroxyacid dehydrogenase
MQLGLIGLGAMGGSMARRLPFPSFPFFPS